MGFGEKISVVVDGPDNTLYTVTTTRALTVLILQKLHLGPPSRSGANGREYLFETQSGAEGNILSPSPSPPPLYSDVVSGCKSVQCTSNRLSFCCHLQRLQILLTVKKTVEASERHPFHLFVVLPNIKNSFVPKGPNYPSLR